MLKTGSSMSSNPPNDSFAALFEQQAASTPRQRAMRVGERIEGLIVKLSNDTAFIELDGKRQAYMEAGELRAADGTMTVKVGDRIVAHVIEADERSGSIRLARSMGKTSGVSALEQARQSGMAVEGKVTGVNKGGLEVDFGGTRAFCPISQADNRYIEDPSTLIGKSLNFVVTEVRDGGKKIVVSRRLAKEREAKEGAAELLKTIVPGAIVRGTVTSVRDFGAFVDLGGIEGLIPNSQIAYDRSVSASDAVKPGEVVEVQVREVKEVADPRSGSPNVKITLSLKSLAADPWEGIETQVQEGKVTMGTVTRVMDFGLFVRLAAGVEGLLHVSELGAKGSSQPKPGVGESIPVVVTKIDRTAKKISLSLAPMGLSAGETIQPLRLVIGTIVGCSVEKIETFGVFVRVDGTTGRAGRGLIPAVELGVQRGTDLRKTFPEGTHLQAKVLETGEGKLRLSVRGAHQDSERSTFESFQTAAQASGNFGTFGDLLSKKSSSKKKK